MIGFNHALAGIGIALSVRNPLLVAPIALISHFLLDIIPHFHHESFGNTLRRPYTRRFKQVLLFDTVVTIGITLLALYFWPDLWFVLSLGIFFAMLPDFLWPLYDKVPQLERFFRFHLRIQRYERTWGFIVEVPFVIILCLLIFS